MLGDRAFTNEPNIRTPDGDDDTVHMQHRARIENSFGEWEAGFHAIAETWRHSKALQPPTIILAAALYNFKKRQRLIDSLHLMDDHQMQL